jgi:alkanesulfonate monooxygenase SsuD/methylene tetrahydromethanopterin reductase-like flavin-dependent oxidoreductase (luciferase family)
MLGFNVFAAESDAEARLLATSMQQSFVNLRSGRPTQLPPPMEGYDRDLPPAAKAMLAGVLSSSAIGSAETVRRSIAAFIERTKPDELILTSQIHDHAARLRSYEIVAELFDPSPQQFARIERGQNRPVAQLRDSRSL